MAIMYGMLRGHPDRYKREDNASTPQLQIRILDESGQPWRIAASGTASGDDWQDLRRDLTPRLPPLVARGPVGLGAVWQTAHRGHR